MHSFHCRSHTTENGVTLTLSVADASVPVLSKAPIVAAFQQALPDLVKALEPIEAALQEAYAGILKIHFCHAAPLG